MILLPSPSKDPQRASWPPKKLERRGAQRLLPAYLPQLFLGGQRLWRIENLSPGGLCLVSPGKTPWLPSGELGHLAKISYLNMELALEMFLVWSQGTRLGLRFGAPESSRSLLSQILKASLWGRSLSKVREDILWSPCKEHWKLYRGQEGTQLWKKQAPSWEAPSWSLESPLGHLSWSPSGALTLPLELSQEKGPWKKAWFLSQLELLSSSRIPLAPSSLHALQEALKASET